MKLKTKSIQKKSIQTISLIFILVFAVISACKPSSAEENKVSSKSLQKESSPKENKAQNPKDGVMVYYFHGSRRCRTCVGLQETISDTVSKRFAQQVKDGTVVFKELNIEEEANKHFIPKFELSFSTLVVEAFKDGKSVKWENCNEVWNKVNDHLALAAYTQQKISEYLNLAGVK